VQYARTRPSACSSIASKASGARSVGSTGSLAWTLKPECCQDRIISAVSGRSPLAAINSANTDSWNTRATAATSYHCTRSK